MTRLLVEGEGDERSVPILLQKTVGRRVELSCIDMGGKSNIVRLRNGFEHTVLRQQALGFVEFQVLLDGDVFFAPYANLHEEVKGMSERAKQLEQSHHLNVRIVWAVRNYESWLIGGIMKGARYCGLARINKPVPGDTQSSPDDPKEWLRERLLDGRYNPDVQLCLSLNINWTQASKRNNSLRIFVDGFY